MSIGRAVLHWRLERWAVLCGVGCSLGGCADGSELQWEDGSVVPPPSTLVRDLPTNAPAATPAPTISDSSPGLIPDSPARPATPPVLPAPALDSAIPQLPVTRSAGAKPILGGTLLVTQDGHYAALSDPDRARVFVVDLQTDELVGNVELEETDEPGRLVEADGRVYVTLRRGNALAEIEVESATQLRRIPVCAAPTGIDFDAQRYWLVVACHAGKLLALDVASGEPTWHYQTTGNLRDVVVSGGRYFASRLKGASVEAITPGTEAVADPQDLRLEPKIVPETFGFTYAPSVLRRMQRTAQGEVLLQHQYANQSVLTSQYYGSGPGITFGALSTLTANSELTNLVRLPRKQFYDVAASFDGSRLAAVSLDIWMSSVHEMWRPAGSSADVNDSGQETWNQTTIDGQASAIAYDFRGRLLVQVREPGALQVVGGARIELSQQSVFDTGQALFHASTGVGVACASCHPEGGDDGVTWDFAAFGPRQTQSLQGGLLDTLPLHWEGERADFLELMNDTFVTRMAGQTPSPAQAQAVGQWLNELMPLPRPATAQDPAIERGREAFIRAECDACHKGDTLTDNQNYDVGTGRPFQTPTLRHLSDTAPYMHDGCAKTLHERFEPACGGDKHGRIENLTPQERDELVTYLLSL